MKHMHCSHTTRYLFLIFGVCFLFRAMEYMLLRTDQGAFGEAFVHKLMGILVLSISVQCFSFTWRQIGFVRKGAGKKILWGLLLGGSVYVPAYFIEFFVQHFRGGNPAFQFYAARHTINASHTVETTLLFFVVCIAGNLINVVMEEGVFRGLFIKLMESRGTFMQAALFSSVLFGLWHIAAPMRSFWDGEMGAAATILYAWGYALLSCLVGFKFCLLAKITGSLWMPMADHFFNNTILNLLHVVAATGIDELQVLRVVAAQTTSFLLVLWLYRKRGAYAGSAFRPKATLNNNTVYRKDKAL